MKNKKESFLKGILFLLLSQIFIKIIGLAYKLYLTNKSGFGDRGNAIYSSGFQIYALLLTFSSTGVPNAISKLVSERLAIGDSRGAYTIFKIAFITFGIIGVIGSVFLFFSSKMISNVWMQMPEAEYCLVCLSPSIFFVSITAVLRGYFNGRQNFSVTAKSQAIEQVFKTIFTILLVEMVVNIGKKNTIIMASAANLATTCATLFSFIYIYLFYKTKKYEIGQEISQSINHVPTRIRRTIKQIINVAFPISISSLIASFNKNIDSFTIVRYLKKITTEESAKIQYGILSGKVDSLCTIAFSFNIPFVTALVPSITQSFVNKNVRETSKKAELFILISILISLPITMCMFCFSEQILQLLFPNANMGANLLKISSISIIFMLLSQTINGILQGIGKVSIPPISLGIGMIFKLICNVTLISNNRLGIYGAIIGNIMCNVISFIIGITIIYRQLHIKFKICKLVLKPIIITSIMGGFSIMIYEYLKCIKSQNMATILALGVGSIVYCILLLKLKVFSKEEISLLTNKKK